MELIRLCTAGSVYATQAVQQPGRYARPAGASAEASDVSSARIQVNISDSGAGRQAVQTGSRAYASGNAESAVSPESIRGNEQPAGLNVSKAVDEAGQKNAGAADNNTAQADYTGDNKTAGNSGHRQEI